MKRKLNVGIVGFGYMGKMHAMCYDNIKYYYNMDVEVNLYAVVSSKKKEEIPVAFEKVYTTYEELLADENVDIVDICAPNYMHAQVLVKAIRKNKHIYCEKPLAVNLQAAGTVLEACRECGYDKIARIAFEYRFVPAVIRAKQLINSGAIGRIIHFNFRYYGCEFLDPNRCISWQSTKETAGGGVLYAMGTHAIDLIHYLVGDVGRVFAQQKTWFKERPSGRNPNERCKVEIEDILNAQFECRNEAVGTLLLSQVAAGSGIDFSFEICGEKGAVRFHQANPNVIEYYNNEDVREPYGGFSGFKAIETAQKYGGEAVFPPPRVNISWSRYHIASIYQFLHGIMTNTGVHPDLGDGYKVQQVTDAIYRSAKSGKIETVD